MMQLMHQIMLASYAIIKYNEDEVVRQFGAVSIVGENPAR